MIQHINNSLGSFISHAGEFYLSQSAQSSLSNFAHSFESTERLRHTENTEASPPAPLRMERGVVCEVTPFGLLLIADGPLNIWRTYRGISVITPLSIRRGVGGEASEGLRHTENTERYCFRWGEVCERGELIRW